MSTRPDWAMDRAAKIVAQAYSPQNPTDLLNYVADHLLVTRLEGERFGMDQAAFKFLEALNKSKAA